MTIPAKAGPKTDVIESVLIKGDLALLSEQERVNYYMRVCDSLGLNPLTRPFAYQKFQGQLILYARKDCTDQLRRLHNISLKLVSQSVENDILTAHAQAALPEVLAGMVRERTDEDVGSVFFPDSLKGENRANAIMKAVTKAKRRVTLSICGLGLLDETEIGADDAPDRTPQAPAANVLVSPPPSPPTAPVAAGAPASPLSPTPQGEGAGALSLEDMAREAAKKGEAIFQVFWNNRPVEERAALAPLATELRRLMDEAQS